MRRPSTHSLTWRSCLAGRLPAEALPSAEREELVARLWQQGWSDVEIAAHTFMSTYTTTRIRTRLELPAHRPGARDDDAPAGIAGGKVA